MIAIKRAWLLVKAVALLPVYDCYLYLLAALLAFYRNHFEYSVGLTRALLCSECGLLHSDVYWCRRRPVKWCMDCQAWRETTVAGDCTRTDGRGPGHVLHPTMKRPEGRVLAWREGMDLKGRAIKTIKTIKARDEGGIW